MSLREAPEPFYFYSRLNLLDLTGVKARTARQLMEGIRKADDAVIYYHTHHYLQQHQYLSPEPPNDFAYWATEILGDWVLGERLASIDICQYSNLASLRGAFVQCLRSFLKEKGLRRSAPPGQEFQFIKAITFVLPTGHVAHDLAEFHQILQEITIHSLYFHIFEARLRLEKRTNDFSAWLEDGLGEVGLAREIERLDPYTHTMEGLRQRISAAILQRLEVYSAEA